MEAKRRAYALLLWMDDKEIVFWDILPNTEPYSERQGGSAEQLSRRSRLIITPLTGNCCDVEHNMAACR